MQFGVLFRKDWIYWKRNRVASVLEIVVPLLLALIMLLIKPTIKKEKFPNEIVPRFPVPTLSGLAALNATDPVGSTLLKSASRLIKNCTDKSRGGYIALAPQNAITLRLKSLFEAMNRTTRFFESGKSLDDEVASDTYALGPYVDSRGVEWPNQACFGVVFHSQAPLAVNYSLRFNTSVNGYGDMYKTQLNPRLGYKREDLKNFEAIVSTGVLGLQMLIDAQIVEDSTGVKVSPGFQKFMVQEYDFANYSGTIQNMIALLLTLSTLISYLRVITRVVSEREARNIEHMENMGLSKGAYLLSTYVFTTIIQIIVALGVSVLLRFGVLSNVNWFALFLLYFMFAMAIMSIAFFVASFFTTTKRGLITGLIVFLILFLFYVLKTSITDPTQGLADFVSIVPTGALTQIIVSFLTFADYSQPFGFQEMKMEIFYFYGSTFYVVCFVEWLGFTLLAFYLLYVWPHDIGVARHPLFIFGYNGSRPKRINPSGGNSSSSSDESEFDLGDLNEKRELVPINPEDFEEIEEELKAQEKAGKTVNMAGVYKVYGNQKLAVRNLNMTMYSDQIFALLGHNGAGKTTAISMLSGLLPLTSGSISIYGMDVKLDHEQIRRSIGICPQVNPVFGYMTVWEHMELYGNIKGVKEGLKDEITRLLTELDLYHKRDYLADKLSGGQKRKLCVALAFVGDSKVVLLDEPTSGLDTYARRHLWEMLKKYKKDRLIILTTHNMDEADFLGDRIGIMSEGRLATCGSSIFLKRRFGDGYELTVLKRPEAEGESMDRLKQLIKGVFPNSRLVSEIGSEMKFRLPENPTGFRELFEQMETNQQALGIQSFGIDMNTLEDVFIKVAKIATGRAGRGFGSQASLPNNMKLNGSKVIPEGDPAIRPNSPLTMDLKRLTENNTGLFGQQLKALILKRYLNVVRDWTTIACEVFMPIVTVIIGLGIAKIRFFTTSPSLVMDGKIYPGEQNFTANAFTNDPKTDPVSGIIKRFTVPDFASNQTGVLSLDDFSRAIWAQNSSSQLFAFHVAAAAAGFLNYTLLVNTTAPFIPFVAVNQFTNALLSAYQPLAAQAALAPPATVSFFLEPLGLTKSYASLNATFSGFIVVLLVVQAFALIPNSLIQFIVKERENNAKHQQIVSGTSVWTYWVSNFLVDYVKYLIPGLVVYAMFFAFGASFFYDGPKAGYTILLIFLYGAPLILLTYLLSYLFRSPGNAQIFAFIFFSFISFVLVIISFVLKVIPDTKDIGLDIIPYVFNLVTPFSLGNALMNLANDFLYSFIYKWPSVPGPFDIKIGGQELIYLSVFTVAYAGLITLIESWDVLWKRLKGGKKKASSSAVDPEGVLVEQGDADVALEEEAVKKQTKAYSVYVEDLEKVYKISGKGLFSNAIRKRAINNVTFGVEQGTVFCLLGTNGAGKTTTFKILTGDITATTGRAVIRGLELPEKLGEIRQLVGYCPQFDSLSEKLTAQEHLQLYCDLKGIERKYQAELIENMLESLNLAPYRNVQAETYSGGNKRKLSIAIALIGQPPIVFLDEPSAGMDPEARRFMWNFISEISSKRAQSSIILTTHSMEEAQALSSKVAIMVEGRVKTIGSIQRLKDKYGKGFEVEIKLKLPEEETLVGKIDRYRSLVSAQKPDSMTKAEIERLLQALKRPDLIDEIADGRRGSAIHQRIKASGMAEDKVVVEWIEIQISLQRVYEALQSRFEVSLVEAYQSYAKFNLSDKHRLSEVFGFMESELNRSDIANFAVREISLEQIFIQFAQNIVHED